MITNFQPWMFSLASSQGELQRNLNGPKSLQAAQFLHVLSVDLLGFYFFCAFGSLGQLVQLLKHSSNIISRPFKIDG